MNKRGLGILVIVLIVLIAVLVTANYFSNNIFFGPQRNVFETSSLSDYDNYAQVGRGGSDSGGVSGSSSEGGDLIIFNDVTNCLNNLAIERQITPKGYLVQEGNECGIVTLLNSNLGRIYGENPGLEDYEKYDIAEELSGYFDEWVDKVNNDDNKANNIDSSDGIDRTVNEDGEISGEAQEVSNCKRKAMDDLRGVHPDLVVPEAETETVIFYYNTGGSSPSEFLPFGNDWKSKLMEALSEGKGATATLDLLNVGAGSLGHAVTIIGIDCESKPPRITIIDPATGEISELDLDINDNTGQIFIDLPIPGGGSQPAQITVITVVG